MGRTRRLAAACLALLVLSGCNGAAVPSSAPRHSTSPTHHPTHHPTNRPTNRPAFGRLGTQPPAWLGTRYLPLRPDGYGVVRPTPPALRVRRFTLPDTVAMLPGSGFAARVRTPAPASVIARSSWHPGCPVSARQLSWLRLTFWGFDHARHTGELLVNASVAHDVVTVFHRLYDARFPMEQVVITGPYKPGGPTTGDANGTGGFVCRASTGSSYFSQHAYGLAIDVNTFQNPYHHGDLVLPELASSYLERSWVRPGMIEPGDVVVRAFASIGWEWGGSWHDSKDYQHFSQNGL
jgi:hypothetical protein